MHIRYGRGLPNRDDYPGDKSDPYVEVIARSRWTWTTKRLHTGYVDNDHNPVWNQQLDFGVDNWYHFSVKVHDEDFVKSDDSLSVATGYGLTSHSTCMDKCKKAL